MEEGGSEGVGVADWESRAEEKMEESWAGRVDYQWGFCKDERRARVGFLWDQMERFDLVPACQIPSRSTISPIHMHTASKQPGAMQKHTEAGGREEGREVGRGRGEHREGGRKGGRDFHALVQPKEAERSKPA